MSRGITQLEAIETVLREADRPLRAKDIVQEIHRRQLTKIGGTVTKTVNARISADIKKNGDTSIFMRVGPGLYTIRGKSDSNEYISIPHGRRMSDQERVLVFPTELISEVGYFHAIHKDYEKYLDKLLNPNSSFFMERVKAERTAEFKQIISYVIINDGENVLRFTRGAITNIGDSLQGLYSIGFGGHIEKSDFTLFALDDLGYAESVSRELREEIGLSISIEEVKNSIVGVLNDDSSALGRRHFAILHMLNMEDFNWEKGEKSVNELGLIEINKLADDFGKYEYWSNLFIRSFFGDRISLTSYVQPINNFSLRNNFEILAVAGYIGCGKTEVSTLLENEFGYNMIRVSRIMTQIIGCPPIEEIGRTGIQNEGLDFIQSRGGHQQLAQGVEDYMNEHPGDKFVIDGLRFPDTLHTLINKINKPVAVIYIDNTIDNLFRYYQDRDSSDASFNQFLEIVHHPVEREIERFREIANVIVYNHGSLDSYIREMRKYFESELRGNDKFLGSERK